MTPDQIIALAVQPLTRILDGSTPADIELTRFFKQRGSGPKERTPVGDLVFTVLRHQRRLQGHLLHAAPNRQPGPLELAAAALADLQAWDALQLRALLHEPPPSLPLPPFPTAPPAEECSLPDWIWDTFVDQWGLDTAQKLGHALNQPAPTDLRVNRLRSTREQTAAALAAEGVITTPLPLAPDGLRLTRHHPVTTLTSFRQGGFEIQDEGSQLISLLLAPCPGETVIDLCAGAGGKTLHMAALMRNQGRILAADSDTQRLARLPQRIRRAGIRIIQTLPLRHEGDPSLRPWTSKADAVLVDAPCSGIGTLRRRPEVKWRLTPDQITTFHHRQRALLAAGARLTRPGGRLVYATCSLLPQENAAVANAFLRENHDFRLVPAMATLAEQGITGLYCTDSFLTLMPHSTGCDGFFAALFKRNR
ncbi:MAG: RsmB/NOP family class I SAM-dependent RNA methyltransferase [Magnetococcus sp. YQC-5]